MWKVIITLQNLPKREQSPDIDEIQKIYGGCSDYSNACWWDPNVCCPGLVCNKMIQVCY